MELYQVDDKGQLFISPDIDDWQPLKQEAIDVVFDLDGGLDISAPSMPNHILYIYFQFEDRDLPDEKKLHELAQLGAHCIQNGSKVLSHCGMGHNRSALLAGLILYYLGMSGADAVEQIRQHRKGALYNKNYANYLQNLPKRQRHRAFGFVERTIRPFYAKLSFRQVTTVPTERSLEKFVLRK
jgi:protein-tyrosine phosphatase